MQWIQSMKKMAGVAAATAVLGVGASANAQLLGFYEFDGDVTDSSGNGINGSGGGVYATGNRGQALDISGTANRYAILPIDTSPGVAPKITFGGWVYTTSDQAYQTIIQQDGDWARKIVVDDRGPTFPIDGFGAFNGYTDAGGLTGFQLAEPTVGQTGTWKFVAAVYDNTTSTTIAWSDTNKSTSTDSFTRISAGGRDDLHVGSIAGSFEAFQGQIDDVFVFNGALSDAQIATLRDAADPLAAAQAISATMSKTNPDAIQTVKFDFQGGSAQLSQGPISGFETWQEVNRSGGSASVTNAVDVNGSATGMNFTIHNGLDGDWNNNGESVSSDYFYTLGGGDSYSPDFTLSGLTPGATYRLTPITGIGGSPLFIMADIDGDGDSYFTDNADGFVNAETFSGQTRSVEAIASASGEIVGEFYFNQFWEGQIAGLVVEQTAIPEPATAMLLLAGAGCLLARRSRK